MSALPPSETRLMRAAARAAEDVTEAAAQADITAAPLAARWTRLHASATRIAQLAELSPGSETRAVADFPIAIAAANPWQRELAARGLDDIEAMLRPGLHALETIVARGGSPVAPALALWREFHEAREALLQLARSVFEIDPA